MPESEEVILSRMKENILAPANKEEGSFVHDAVAPVALEATELQRLIEVAIAYRFSDNPDDLTDEHADLKAAEQQIYRKVATSSEGYVRVVGATGTVINQDDVFLTQSATVFKATQLVTIPVAGVVNVPIVAEIPGSTGNVAAGLINQTSIPGIASVTNPEDTRGGADTESTESLMRRYYLQVRNRPGTGNQAHYKKIALEVPGVADVKIFRAWNGPGTAKLVLLSQNKRTPSASIIAEVQRRVDENTPINDPVITVVGVTEVMISVSATLMLKSGGAFEAASKQAEEAISEYFYDIAFVDPIVRYAKTGEAILSADEVLDYSGLKISNSTANIELQDDQIPILGVLNLSIGG